MANGGGEQLLRPTHLTGASLSSVKVEAIDLLGDGSDMEAYRSRSRGGDAWDAEWGIDVGDAWQDVVFREAVNGPTSSRSMGR